MARKITLSIGTATLLVAATVAFAKSVAILYPEWSKPTQGTYEAPAGELGKRPPADQPWSTTTVSSAVDRPLKGKPVSIVGEVIDYSCYLQVGKHGDKHRDCGQKCLRNGMPMGLLAKDGTIYLLMDEEHNPRRDGQTDFRSAAIERMAHVVTVHGTQSEVKGQKAIFVQGYMK